MAVLKDKKQPRLYEGKYPSVTEVLNVLSRPHLDTWRKKVGHAVANEASNRATTLGTRVHALCNAVSVGQSVEHVKGNPLTEQEVLMVQGYEEFLEEYVDEVLHTERSLVSPQLGVGGTLDAYVRLKDGSHAIVDIKTSRGFSAEMGLQLAAYAFMVQELGEPVDHRIIVRLNKDKPGKWYVKYYEDHVRDIEAYKAAVALWSWVHKWYPEEKETVVDTI